jgi:hypothetical protein
VRDGWSRGGRDVTCRTRVVREPIHSGRSDQREILVPHRMDDVVMQTTAVAQSKKVREEKGRSGT